MLYEDENLNKIGSYYMSNGKSSFTVWAPRRKDVSLRIVFPEEKIIPMKLEQYGYWHVDDVPVGPGTRYFYHLDGIVDRPDPASRLQPQGVHGPSEVISSDFNWNDNGWVGVPQEKLIFYELHVGTFTEEGTFEGVIKKLDYLLDLGITAIEIMPVAQFPGKRNWGYDGAYHFAVQNTYGGPDGLKRLVNSCHQRGISVILDVVYNHFGPEGTYVNEFGYYFTNKYHTPWGAAINFDDAWSDGVRNYFFQNAIEWFDNFHIDGLRLDAIHGIFDFGGKHFLRELAEKTQNLSAKNGRTYLLIAESDLNDTRVVDPFELNGYGLDAQWDDDFHHAIIALVTGERKSYYGDFGSIGHLEKAYNDGFIYSWKYSENRKRHHGTSSLNVSGKQFVVCIQNHDQIGNRLLGERVSAIVPFDALKLMAGAMFISPYLPLMFMGEEFASDTPFMYFIDHSDPDLVEAVRKGRAQEFADMHCNMQSPDPQSQDVYEKSKINWDVLSKFEHQSLLKFYKKIIHLRKEKHAFSRLIRDKLNTIKFSGKNILIIERSYKDEKILGLMNFSNENEKFNLGTMDYSGVKIIDSLDEQWNGKGSSMPNIIYSDTDYVLLPYQFAIYEK